LLVVTIGLIALIATTILRWVDYLTAFIGQFPCNPGQARDRFAGIGYLQRQLYKDAP
jgi:hypothetical protein